MRFVRLLAASAALACSGLAGQAQATTIITGSTSGGTLSIPNLPTPDTNNFSFRMYTSAPTVLSLNVGFRSVTDLWQFPFFFNEETGETERDALNTPIDADGVNTYTLGPSKLHTLNYLIHTGRQHFSDGFLDIASNGLGTDTLSAISMGGQTFSYKIIIRDLGTITNVPEPSTWALLILGFGAVGFVMRRRAVSLGHEMRVVRT